MYQNGRRASSYGRRAVSRSYSLSMPCAFCREPVEDINEPPPYGGQPVHRECGIRMVIGSVAHQEKRCGCYVPGSEEGDPPHLTLRQAARAACWLHAAKGARD